MTTFKLYWTRADKQGSLPMGDFSIRAEAEAAIPLAKEILLDQCGEDYQKAEIEAGTWSVDDETDL